MREIAALVVGAEIGAATAVPFAAATPVDASSKALPRIRRYMIIPA